MTDWNGSLSRGSRVMETLLWTCAGLVVLTAHVGAAAWLMREQPVIPADDAPPAAIMIELAPEPEAVFTEANEVAPDQQTAELSMPAEQVETLEEIEPEEPAEAIDRAEPEPVQEVAEAEPEEPVTEPVVEELTALEPQELESVEEVIDPIEEETVMLPDVEVPIPTARPNPPEPKKEVAKKKPEPRTPVKQRRQPQAASKQATQAQAQVTKSKRNAARQSASGLFSSVSPARWQSRLMAHLERRKRYPSGARRRGEQGTAYVRFRIDDSGNVLSASLARSSGFPELDNEVLSLVRRASPVPAPPPGVNKTITAPVRFSVR